MCQGTPPLPIETPAFFVAPWMEKSRVATRRQSWNTRHCLLRGDLLDTNEQENKNGSSNPNYLPNKVRPQRAKSGDRAARRYLVLFWKPASSVSRLSVVSNVIRTWSSKDSVDPTSRYNIKTSTHDYKVSAYWKDFIPPVQSFAAQARRSPTRVGKDQPT